MTGRPVIGLSSVPRLPTGVRLKYDDAREQWVVLAPERLFVLDPIAHAIVDKCDGVATVDEIAGVLSDAYQAPRDQIETDIVQMLQDLADKGVIEA